MTSLQKESEWEKEFDEKFWIYFVQYYPEKENGLFGSIKSFIYQTISNRENEIAEEVKKKIKSAGGLGGWKHLDDILNEIILKH